MTTCSLISLENTRNNFTSFWIKTCYLKKYLRIDNHFTKKNYNKESKLHLSLKILGLSGRCSFYSIKHSDFEI